MSEVRGQILSIQVLRAIAATLVVVGHILSRLGHIYGNNSFMLFFDSIYSCGVDLFFVISGFIMITISKDKQYSNKEALSFIKKRFIRIYPIYWIATAGLVLLLLVQFQLSQDSSVLERIGNWQFLLKSFLLIPVVDPVGNYFPVLQVGWTLIFEMFFYILFFVSLFFTKSYFSRLVFLSVIIFSLVLLQISLQEYSSVLLRYYGSTIVGEFLLGCLIAFIVNKNGTCTIRTGIVITSIGALFLVLSGFLPEEYHSSHLGEVRFIKWGIPAAILLYGALSLEALTPKSSWLVLLGDSSYSLYLFHTAIILPVIAEVFNLMNLYETLGLGVTAVVFFIICILGSLLIHKLLELPLTRALYRVLLK